jgi:hypothetical protein
MLTVVERRRDCRQMTRRGDGCPVEETAGAPLGPLRRDVVETTERVADALLTRDEVRLPALFEEAFIAAEDHARATGEGVSPWVYEQAARYYRGREEYESEVAVVRRYARLHRVPGAEAQRLLDRLEDARLLAAGQTLPVREADWSDPAFRYRPISHLSLSSALGAARRA